MRLIERLFKQNPWWENHRVSAIEGFRERELFNEVFKHKDDKQIISIIGLRRVGKTTLMYQVLNKLLKHIDPKRILFFSFDELMGKDPEIIEKILTVFEEEILREELKEVFVFFDEISYIKNWQVILKRYYDLERKIKFFVSGSSGVLLKKAKESLAGRIYEFQLKPLSFREFLKLKGVGITKTSSLTIKKELSNYLLVGAFPEIINQKEFPDIKQYIKSIIDKIIFYDIPKVYDADEPELLKEILGLVVRNPGMLVDYQKIASSLSVSYQTVSKYIKYLEKTFLIRLLYNFRGSPIASARKLKKAHLITPSLAVGFVDTENEFFSLMPKLAEGLVAQHLDARYFWRKYYEIDILHNNLPIEIKYRKTPDIKGALETAKKIKSKKLVVVTKDTEKKETNKGIAVDYVPLWKFLLK